MKTFQSIIAVACLISFLAALAMSEELAKRGVWKGRIGYLVVAGAYLCHAWSMATIHFPFVPWTAVFLYVSHACALSTFVLYLRRHPEFS